MTTYNLQPGTLTTTYSGGQWHWSYSSPTVGSASGSVPKGMTEDAAHATGAAKYAEAVRAYRAKKPVPDTVPVIIPDPLPPAPGPDPWDGGDDAGWDTGGKLEPKEWAFNTSWNVEAAASDFWALGNAWGDSSAGWGVGREDTWSADDTTWGAIMEMFGFNGGADHGGLGW